MAHKLEPGDWITGPFWERPVQVVTRKAREGYDLLTVAADAGVTCTWVLDPDDCAQLARVTPADRRETTFDGDPTRFRLAIEAHRLRLAHSIDPYADGDNPMVLRRTKEEMCKPSGESLYPTRTVVPKYYNISHEEGDLLEQVQKFIRMIAPNTMEGQVKDALLKKMETMREDLGDKVFDVVGQVLWADADLRDILERIALGETGAVDDAREAIERGGEQREEKREALARDRVFLTEGLNGLAEYLSEAAVDAFSDGDIEMGSDLTDQAERARQRLGKLQDEMGRAGRLLMTVPEVLGVALVLPAPLEIEVETEEGVTRLLMRRDDAVEQAAMDAVMAYERRRGQFPKDVHHGESWDIESYDAQGQLVRYIEVKGRGPEDTDVVTMIDPEWAAAQRLGEQHWLYVVRLGDGMLVMIQNPYAKLELRELKRWLVRITDAKGHGETVSFVDD